MPRHNSQPALFGTGTPLVQRAGKALGVFTTAALLYAGAACIGFLLRRPVQREAAVRREDVKRLGSLALFGAVFGPMAFILATVARYPVPTQNLNATGRTER